MISISIFIFIICALLGKSYEKTWINPLTLFSSIWVFIVFLASLGLYGMNKITDTPYLIILMGVVCYTMGYTIYHYKPFKIKIGRISINNNKQYICHEKIFRILLLITMLVWIVLSIITILELQSGITYRMIRDIYAGVSEDNKLFTNKYEDVAIKWFFAPAVNVILAKIIYSFFVNKYKWFYYFASIILLGMYCFTTGSRIILLYSIFQLIFLLFLKRKGNAVLNISRKKKRIIRFAVILALVGVIIITLLRPASSSNAWTTKMTVYAYGSLSVPMLDHWVKYLDTIGTRTHGVAFFRGFLELIARFGIPLPNKYYEYSELISYCANSYIPIFGTKVFNAFNTVFLDFYMDFGYGGVILGSLLFGLVSSGIYNNIRKKDDEFGTIVFLLLLISIIGSFARWQFNNTSYIMVFIIMRLLYKKVKYK